MSIGASKQAIVESLENTCPLCGEQFDAVEFAAPEEWDGSINASAGRICPDYQRHARYIHGVADDTIEEYELVPAVEFVDVQYDLSFESAAEVADQEEYEDCPFSRAGWTHEDAAKLIEIDARESQFMAEAEAAGELR